MTTTVDILTVLKKEMKDLGMTYLDLSKELHMSESSIKRMFSRNDMPLSRIDDICRVLKIDFAEVSRRVSKTEVLLQYLTQEQEESVVSDPFLLLTAISVLSSWSFEQIVKTYNITEAQCTHCFIQLDKIGIIELRPMNRYSLKLAKTFRWKANGPVMTFFREHAVKDYFSGGFDKPFENLIMVHGAIDKNMVTSFTERIQKIAHDFAQQQQLDQKLKVEQKQSLTLLLGMREWEFSAFTSLKRV